MDIPAFACILVMQLIGLTQINYCQLVNLLSSQTNSHTMMRH